MLSRLLLKIISCLAIVFFLGCGINSNDQADKLNDLQNLSVQYQQLIVQRQELLKENPQDQSLRIELAQFYYDFKDYQKVVELLRGRDFEAARVLLAKAFTRLKEYTLAIEIFEQIKVFPQDPEYLYLYGQVLENKNLFPKAIKIYEQVGPPFEIEAKEKIKAIKAKVEEGTPQEIKDISQAAKTFLTKLNDDAAIYLLIDEDTEITAQNTSVSTIHVIAQVLKERGKELAEVDLGYDSTYQRIELEFARTITKEGIVRYVGGENIRDVSRYLNFPLYSNARALIVSMPSVDVGSFIEYKLKIHSSKLVSENNFTFAYRLRESFPVFKARFKLTVPQETQVHFKFFNKEYAKGISLKPSFSENQVKKSYYWKFDEIMPIIPEYAMPPQPYVNPAILISSFSSWDQIYQWWRSLYQDKLRVTSQMKDFLKELIIGDSSDVEKARKIYEFVAKDIRYVAIEYGEGGHEPHYAKEVFINRYGDCKDQAILLVALLREAGLEAYPVLIPTDSVYPVADNFPSLNFNHAIAALKLDNQLIFMDPTSETTPFGNIPLGDQNRQVLVCLDSGWEITNTPVNKENRVNYDMEFIISRQENAEVTRRVRSQGFYAAAYRGYLKYTHPAIIEEDLRKKMREISSLSAFRDYQIENADNFVEDPVLTYKFSAEKFLNPAGKLRIVPVLDQLQLDYKLIGKDKRKYPIDLEGLYDQEARIRMILPNNLKIKYLPNNFDLENRWFKLKVSYESKKKEINFYQKITVRQRFVDIKEYRDFEQALEDAIYRLREEIILEKTR